MHSSPVCSSWISLEAKEQIPTKIPSIPRNPGGTPHRNWLQFCCCFLNLLLISVYDHILPDCPNMQSLRASILSYLRIRVSMREQFFTKDVTTLNRLNLQLRACSTSSSSSDDLIMDRVIMLVKNFNRIDATKVTKTADFQKDLSLDSLDRVELVMAFEQEFSIEIPDEEADKLKCCADVATYIKAEAGHNNAEDS